MTSKRLSGVQRHSQIAHIAAKLFAKKGFNGVTTREIAKKANVNESILFRHFPTKDALYTEIINQKMHVKPDVVNIEAAKINDDAEVFRSVARWFIDEVEKDNTLFRIMLYSALEDHRLADVFLRERTDEVFGFLLKYIIKRINDGTFSDIKPAIILRSFVGMFFHFILVNELFGVPKEFEVTKEEALNYYIDIFLDGIKKK